jgi:Zn-dependent protease
MRMSWKLGRVAGIDVFLHPTLPLLLTYFGLAFGGLETVLLVSAFFGCLLLHELGHALMARRFGIETADITLYPIGGVARLNRLPKASRVELLIALAGPAVNVAIALALWAGLGVLAGGRPAASSLESWAGNLLAMNLLMAGFNMIPAFPMDGGRVLRALLSGWLGRGLATEIAAALGRGLALTFGLYSLLSGAPRGVILLRVVLAAFIFFVAGLELGQVRAEEHRRRRLDGGSGDDSGVWVAPPGYLWVDRGNGVWQLAPIAVSAAEPDHSWR